MFFFFIIRSKRFYRKISNMASRVYKIYVIICTFHPLKLKRDVKSPLLNGGNIGGAKGKGNWLKKTREKTNDSWLFLSFKLFFFPSHTRTYIHARVFIFENYEEGREGEKRAFKFDHVFDNETNCIGSSPIFLSR